MKKITTKKDTEDLEIPSFDFENSLPNKYAKSYSENNQTNILNANKITTIVLDSDLADYFPDSKSVNFALRSILKAIPVLKQNKRRPNSKLRQVDIQTSGSAQ